MHRQKCHLLRYKHELQFCFPVSALYVGDVSMSLSRTGSSARDLITVVGTFPDVNKGSQLRCAGHWEVHKTHGLRLKAINFEEVVPDSPDAIAAYLSSVIDGACVPA